MKRNIKNVAVIGSGVMGSGIACHFANIGINVLLLDIAPNKLNEKEEKLGLFCCLGSRASSKGKLIFPNGASLLCVSR
jgi:3-hydroxyisobutyrate dehydrogenase-like beta-hydroxyacid dehydrogenase